MSLTEQDMRSREIITKAVCGKGRKFTQATHTITPSHSPSSILGCWIINHDYAATKVGDAVEVSGSYDINIWYSCQNNTKTDVATETVSYVDQVPLAIVDKNHMDHGLEVNAKDTQQPTACEATISNSGNAVYVQVEREFLVELIGETKVCVVVSSECGDDFEDKEFDFDEDIEQNFEDLDPEITIDDLN